MKLVAAGGTCSLNAFQGLMKGILGKILAFFPVAGQTVDGMKDQFAIFLNKFFYRLGGMHAIHRILFIHVVILRDTYGDARGRGFVTEFSMKKVTKRKLDFWTCFSAEKCV